MIQRILSQRSSSLRRPTTASKIIVQPRTQRCIFANLQPFRSSSPITLRHYATEPHSHQHDTNNEPTPSSRPVDAGSSTDTVANNEVNEKDREILELKDKYLRSVADFRNLQERTKREVQAAKDFAIQRFAKDLVESVDNLDRALSTVPEEKLKANGNQDLVNLYDGLRMTDSILMSTMKKHGLERFDPSENAEVFNPNEHEATFMTAMQGKENNTVFHTQQKGFKLNGRILRAAKVGVVKNV